MKSKRGNRLLGCAVLGTKGALATALLAGAALVSLTPPADAAVVSYAFNGVFGSGVGTVNLNFTTDDSTSNAFGGINITSITGTVGSYGSVDALVQFGSFTPPTSNVTINNLGGTTAVINAGTGLNLNGDNTYFPSDPHFDSANGILFHLSNNDYVNMWGNSPGSYSLAIGNPSVGAGVYPLVVNTTNTGTAGITVVPLPAALPLLVSGLGLLGFIGRRRKTN